MPLESAHSNPAIWNGVAAGKVIKTWCEVLSNEIRILQGNVKPVL